MQIIGLIQPDLTLYFFKSDPAVLMALHRGGATLRWSFPSAEFLGPARYKGRICPHEPEGRMLNRRTDDTMVAFFHSAEPHYQSDRSVVSKIPESRNASLDFFK